MASAARVVAFKILFLVLFMAQWRFFAAADADEQLEAQQTTRNSAAYERQFERPSSSSSSSRPQWRQEAEKWLSTAATLAPAATPSPPTAEGARGAEKGEPIESAGVAAPPFVELQAEERVGRPPNESEWGVAVAAGSARPAAPEPSAADGGQEAERAAGQAAEKAAQLNYAELCYLANGGSSLTLTVNEATQVGAIIGTVEVNGDPSLYGGNVDLFVAQDSRTPTSSSSDAPLEAQTAPGGANKLRQQRILGRRSLGEPHVERVARTPTPAASTSQLLGLANDGYQSASSSFYSLVASTVAPSSPATPTAGSTTPQATPPQQAAVRLEPGTKNLILVRALDKESAEDEAGLVVSVRCVPRHQPPASSATPSSAESGSSPARARPKQALESSSIPVRILVTDANDHAPEFVNALQANHAATPLYVVNISETAPLGSVASREILAIDRDSAGPFSTVHYKLADSSEGANAALQFANPLDPTLVLAAPLDYEQLAAFTLTVVAHDEGEPEPMASSAQVQVNVIDFDDQNPKFLDDKYTLVMDDTQQGLVGQNLQILPRNLYAEDGDRGINAPVLYSFDQLTANLAPAHSLDAADSQESPSSSTNANLLADEPTINVDHYLHLNPSSGEVRLIRHWPSKWMGSPMTLVVRATQADNKDRYTLTTLTITRSAGSAGGGGQQQQTLKQPAGSSKVNQQQGGQPRGIQFAPDKLSVEVLESAPVNEKIARVRARYLDAADQVHLADEPGASSAANESQAVDLIQEPGAQLQLHGGRPTRPPSLMTRAAPPKEPQKAAQRRPINYQILDDQTEQFAINGLGELSIRRPLDFELRQEFNFRVLATYTKYSDICQVHVRVVNVNDNKPKFTQPQYTFHLTESRLRSNLIGSVLAHDADLNDSLQYSLVAGDHAHLFELNPRSGQLSLRGGTKQLNVSHAQLLVQASDTLGSGARFSHQARVNLHVAPQLVGRSLNLDQQQPASSSRQAEELAGKTFISRSLSASESGAEWQPGGGGGQQQWRGRTSPPPPAPSGARQKEPAASSQRSSVATVMSSLQHMVRSVNFLEMPMSSALLLSALLAFLICLLFILLISMSVHLYRRRSKRASHRHHLAASAAHLRHAHLAAALHQPPPPGGPAGAGPQPAPAAQVAGTGLRPSNSQASTPSAASSSSASSSSCSNSTPTRSTAAGNSPNYSSGGPTTRSSPDAKLNPGGGVAFARVPFSKLTARVSPAVARRLPPKPQHQRTASASLALAAAREGVANPSPRHASSAQQARGGGAGSLLSSPVAGGCASPLETLSGQLAASPGAHLAAARANIMAAAANAAAAASASAKPHNNESSLISSLSNQSKRSYRSNTTDDSSVMHCGHYSVNPVAPLSPLSPALMQQLAAARSPELPSGPATPMPGDRRPTSAGQDKKAAHKSAIEAAIHSLVRAEEEERGARVDADDETEPGPKEKQARLRTLNELKLQAAGAKELAALYSDPSATKPGIKSYRKLPLGSLVRPQKRAAEQSPSGSGAEAENRQQQQQQDSAIASDASSSGASQEQKQQQQEQQQLLRHHADSAGLMALIRSPARPLGDRFANEQQQEPKVIRWPAGATPSRVKKLTWDDELSCVSTEDAECFIAPEMQQRLSAGLVSPLSNHQYPIQGTTNQANQQYAEQHFLFSNACSPSLTAAELGSLAAPNSGSLARQANSEEPQSSFMGQNNCLDYTIVQSSQFHVDAFASERLEPLAAPPGGQQPSLSAQHHLLQQQQQLRHKPTAPNSGGAGAAITTSYLYSNPASSGRQQLEQQQQQQQHQQAQLSASANNHNQDLNQQHQQQLQQRLMTSALL